MSLTNYPNGMTSFGIPMVKGPTVPRRNGKVFFVDALYGSDSYKGRSINTPLSTLQKAIDLCTSDQGDTIYVAPGSYEEQITVDKNYVNIIGMIGGQYGWPDIEAAAGVTLSNETGQGLYLENLRIAATAGNIAAVQGANGYIFKNVRFHGDTAASLDLRAGNTDEDDSYTASEGWLVGCELAWGSEGILFTNPGPSGGFGGVGPTDVRIIDSVFHDITNQDIKDVDTAGSNDSCFGKSLIHGCKFLDRNKAVYVTLTNGGGNTGLISGNFFADDAGLNGTKIAIATGIVFAGNFDAVGVRDGSTF